MATAQIFAAYGRPDTHLIATLDNGNENCIAYPGGAYRKRTPRFFRKLAQAQAYLDKLV